MLTHFHADHVGGVVTAPNARELARKTIVSTETAKYMVTAPHRPHLKLDEQQIREFIVLDYAQYYPVAPGVVLIKAAGHSPDHQMVFVRLASGRELLHSVDTAWVLDNILQVKGKAAPWVKEDVPAVMSQLAWLNEVHAKEKQLTLLVTHDDVLFDRVTQSGAIGTLAV